MSDYTVILEVSRRLRDLLWENFDDQVRNIVGTPGGIVFTDPTVTASQDANRLSVWMYQVTENEFVKNQPVQQGKGSRDAQPPPLAINLYFLITPFAGNPEADLLLLGKTIQVLYDNAVVPLRVTDAGVAEELRVIFRPLTIEELAQVWQALQESYRLSVSYQIRVLTVESTRRIALNRISDRSLGAGSKPLALATEGSS